MRGPDVTVVIPVYNEEGFLGRTLDALSHAGGNIEVIVVDGQSSDGTVDVANAAGARVLSADRGRGLQLHTGARAASAPVLWFLHADTIVPPEAVEAILESLRTPDVVGGNFRLRFDGDSRGARQLTVIYPKLRALGLCYGDSGIFVRRSVYDEVGGFQPYPIFEDVDLIRRIKRRGRFVLLNSCLLTSSRRFEQRSFAGMFAQWSALQVLYWMGVSPFRLGHWYTPKPTVSATTTPRPAFRD